MTNKRNVVLASQSPRRRELLSELIPNFKIMADTSDETFDAESAPEETVVRLAMKKAKNVAARSDSDAIVIAADTVVFIDGRILGKPADENEAAEMLRKLSGRDHHVCTGIAIIDNLIGKSYSCFERTVVHFKPLTDAEIEGYIASGEPMDKAGAYGIQAKGALFVEWIKGDYFNVVGLPLCRLGKVLKEEFDFDISQAAE